VCVVFVPVYMCVCVSTRVYVCLYSYVRVCACSGTPLYVSEHIICSSNLYFTRDVIGEPLTNRNISYIKVFVICPYRTPRDVNT
jgi:hypothetical protein